MTDSHEHSFDQVQLKRIVEVQPKYHGTAGDKAFLLRKCDCGKTQAFDYGNYQSMLVNAKELKCLNSTKKISSESVLSSPS